MHTGRGDFNLHSHFSRLIFLIERSTYFAFENDCVHNWIMRGYDYIDSNASQSCYLSPKFPIPIEPNFLSTISSTTLSASSVSKATDPGVKTNIPYGSSLASMVILAVEPCMSRLAAPVRGTPRK